MATNWNIEPMRIARTPHDAPPLRNEQFLEESAQAFSKYDPVQLDASTQELEIYDDNTGKVIGITKKAASGVAGSATVIEEIHQDDICEANAINDGDGDADDAIAATDIGKKYGVKEHTDGNWVIDLSDTTNVRVKITGLAGMSQIGDYHARVEFVWIPDFLFYGVDSA